MSVSSHTRRGFLLGAAAGAAAAGAASLISGPAEARSTSTSNSAPNLKDPGSVSGAPFLPAGFRDTFSSQFVDAGGIRLHAVVGGKGPPLLLVHGWPQTWYQWRLVMPELA